MYRFGARRWLACIMVCWGLGAALKALVTGPATLSTIRFIESSPGRLLPRCDLLPHPLVSGPVSRSRAGLVPRLDPSIRGDWWAGFRDAPQNGRPPRPVGVAVVVSDRGLTDRPLRPDRLAGARR